MLRKRTRENRDRRNDIPKLVSLACHDLRTPLATVYGFARTITRADGLDPTLAATRR
jgi:signal transduction histidine kinase